MEAYLDKHQRVKCRSVTTGTSLFRPNKFTNEGCEIYIFHMHLSFLSELLHVETSKVTNKNHMKFASSHVNSTF